MSPDGGGEPDGALGDAINSAFGSFADFQASSRTPASTSSAPAGRGSCTTAPGLAVVGTPNQDNPISARPDAAARRRRLGARLLPEVPEPPPRLHRRVVERRQLGQGRRALSAAGDADALSPPRRNSRPGAALECSR